MAMKMEMSDEEIIEKYLKEFRISQKIKIKRIFRQVTQDAIYLYSSYGIHMTDAIHAIAAKNNECTLVTRDKELIAAANHIGLRCCELEKLIRLLS